MPETDFDTARFMKGRGPEGFENARKFLAVVRGRPRKGEQSPGSTARSLRLPDTAWAELEQEAKKRKVSLHKLLRLIVANHLYTEWWTLRQKRLKEAKAVAPKASRSARKPQERATTPKRRARKAA